MTTPGRQDTSGLAEQSFYKGLRGATWAYYKHLGANDYSPPLTQDGLYRDSRDGSNKEGRVYSL